MTINGGMGRPLNRVRPKMPTQNYKTYAIRSPLQYRRASCAEIQCYGFVNGWVMQKERMNADQIWAVTHSGRSYKEMAVKEGETLLVFEAGQTCFKAIDDEHQVAMPQGELFIAGRGDHRSFSPRTARVHTRPQDWVEDLQITTGKNAQERNKG